MRKIVSLAAVVLSMFLAEGRSFVWKQSETPDVWIERSENGLAELRGDVSVLDWPYEPVGAPAVPYRIIHFAIPDGCAAEGATVAFENTWRTFAADVDLAAIREPVTTDQIDTAPPAVSAAGYPAAVWPAAAAEALPPYTASGVRVLPVRVNVLRYRPAEKLLEAAVDLKVTVTFVDEAPAAPVSGLALQSAGAATRIVREGRVSENLMRSVLEGTVNGAAAEIVDTNKTSSVGGTFGTRGSGLSSGGLKLAAATNTKIDMVIISPPDFMDLWPKYVAYRNETHPHLNIIIKNAAEIYNEFSGVDPAQKIHHYIEGLYRNNGLEYVLLGAAAPGNSDRTLSTAYPLQTKYQIPTRYACTDNSQPADLYYGCMDRIGGTGEVWDRQNDGLFMRTKTGADSAGNCDLVPDLVVFRMPLRPTARDGANNRAISATQQMDGFMAKLRACETWNFAGANRFLYSASKMFDNATIAKGANNDRVLSERWFFDGGMNFFDDRMTVGAMDSVNINRYHIYRFHAPARGIAAVSGCSVSPYSHGPGGGVDSYYTWACDLVSDDSHGGPRGAGNWLADKAFDQTGLHKLHISPIPCLSGYFDYKDGILCASEATVLNNRGGAVAALANAREGWWGGYSTLSGKIEEWMHQNLMKMNVGKALLAAWRSYGTGLGNISSGGGRVLFNENGMGDPLVTMTPQYVRTWIGASGGVQEWSPTAANWRASNPSLYVIAGQEKTVTGVDHSSQIIAAVHDTTTFNITCRVTTPKLQFSVSAGQTLTLSGNGDLRSFYSCLIAGGGDLVWNVAGGCGHTGFAFDAATPGVLRFEGNATRYFGTYMGNVRRVEWPGSNVTFDLSDGSSGGFKTVERSVTITGTGNRIRSYAPVFASDYKVNIDNGGELILETWNCAGTGNYDHNNILFAVRNGSTLAFGNNPRLQTENLSRSVLLENGGAINLRTARFAFGNTAKHGVRVFARGTGNRIYGTGPANINQCVWLDAAADAELSVETGLAGGNAYLVGPGTIKMSGTSTTTGTLRLIEGATVVAQTATALGRGSVVVEEGCTLDLRVIPLTGLKKLIVNAGGRLVLPETGTVGFYQVMEENGTQLQIDPAAEVFSAADRANALEGIATSEGAFLVTSTMLKWRGNDSGNGTWSVSEMDRPFICQNVMTSFVNGSMVVFADVPDNATATVNIDGAVRPAFLDFNAQNTKFRFIGDGTLYFDGIKIARDAEFEANVDSPSGITITGGRVSLRQFNTEAITVEPGAEFRLTGTFSTRTTAAKQLRFEFLTQNSAATPALQGVSFYNGNGTQVGYPSPTLVSDWTGASATRTIGGSHGYLHNGSTAGIQALIDGIYQGNVATVPENMKWLLGDVYTSIQPSPNSAYARNNCKWAPAATSGTKWVNFVFGSAIGTKFGYRFHSSPNAAANPRTWKVYVREDSDDEWVFYADHSATVNSAYTAYDIQYVNFGVPHRTSVTVKSGATLGLDGIYQNTINFAAGAKFKAYKDSALRLNGTFAELKLSGASYEVDASEAENISQWQKILIGANLTEADLGRFVCNRLGSLLKVDEAGDLCIVTEGVITPPFTRDLNEAQETWNGTAGDWVSYAGVEEGGAGVPFERPWDETVVDTKGELTLTVARGVEDISLDARTSEVRIRKITVRQEDPDAAPTLRIVSDGSRAFAADEIDFTAFKGTLYFDVPMRGAARTTVRVGAGRYYFLKPVTGSLAVEDAAGEAHVNWFTEGLTQNAGRVALDQGLDTPVALLNVDNWPGDLAIAKTVAAVACEGTSGAYHVKNGQTLKIRDGAELNIAGHLWTATTAHNDVIDQTGGTITCTGATKPYVLGVTRMTTRHRLSGNAVLNVTTGSADVGDRDESNGYGELEMRDNARAHFAALCLSKGWIDIHPGAALYIGGPNTSSAGSSGQLAGLMTVAGTLGAWQNSPHINIPFVIDFPDGKEILGNAGTEGDAAAETPEAGTPAAPRDAGLPVAKIDANGHAVTLTREITGRGALLVTNTLDGYAGTVTLSATNTYAGGTIVAPGQILIPATAESIGTGGLTLARGAMLRLQTARGVPAQFTADAQGMVLVPLTLEEARTDVPFATVADGVTEIPADLEFTISVDGRMVSGRPVKLVGNMICFDAESAVVAPLTAVTATATQNWTAMDWHDALGRAVAAPDWNTVDAIVVSNEIADAAITLDAPARLRSVAFVSAVPFALTGTQVTADRLDFTAAPAARIAGALADGTEVTAGERLTLDDPGAGTIVIPEGARAVVLRDPTGATIRNAGVLEHAYAAEALMNTAEGTTDAYTGGTDGQTLVQTDLARRIELERGDYKFINLRCYLATVTVHAGATVFLGIGGMNAVENETLTLAGGALVANSSSVTADAGLVLDGGGFIGAKRGCTLYVERPVTGTGTLTVGSAEYCGTVVFRTAPQVDVRIAGGAVEPAQPFTRAVHVTAAGALALSDPNDSGYVHVTDGALTVEPGATLTVNGAATGTAWKQSGGAFRKGAWVTREGDGLWREAKWRDATGAIVAFPDGTDTSAELVDTQVQRIELHRTHTLHTVYVGGTVTLALCDGGGLTLTGARGLDIEGHLTLDLSQRTQPGTIVSGALDPSEVTITGLPASLHVDIDSTSIRLVRAADYPERPAFWFYGSFGPGALVSRGKTLTLNDSAVSADKRFVTVANKGLYVNNVGGWPNRVTMLSTTAGAMTRGAGSRSLLAFSTWQNTTYWPDVIGLRLQQNNYNYYMTWAHEAWSSGNTYIGHLDDDEPHTFALTYDYENGTTPYCDGARIWQTYGGLRGSNMVVTNLAFGAQQYTGSTIAHTGARISSVMAFDARLSDAAVALWSRPRDLVVSDAATAPTVGFARMLALDAAAHTVAGTVEAFALRTTAANARLAFTETGRIRTGLGGADLASVATLDVSGISFWETNAVTIIEGDYYLPATVAVVTGGNPRTVERAAGAVTVVNGTAYYGTLDAAADWTAQTGIAHPAAYVEGMTVNLRAAGDAAALTFGADTALGTVRLHGAGHIRLAAAGGAATIAELDLTDFTGTFELDGVEAGLIRTAAGGATLNLGGRDFAFGGTLAGGGLNVIGGGRFVVCFDAESVLGAPVAVDDATEFVLDVSEEDGPVTWDWNYPATRVTVRTGARRVGFHETAVLVTWGRTPETEIVLEDDNGGRFAVTKLSGGLQFAATIGTRVTLVRDGAEDVEINAAARWQSAGVVYDWADLLDHGYTGEYALAGAGTVTAYLTAAGALRLSETRTIEGVWRVVNNADAPLALAYDGAGTATNTVNLSSASVLSIAANVTVRRMHIGDARMRGHGTVINDGALPTGTNGYDDAAHWHGTVQIMNIAVSSNAQILNAVYANATSAVEYNNAGGWGPVDTAATRFAFPCREVRVGPGGWTFYSGTSNAAADAFYRVWSGELTGEGTVTIVNGAYHFREVFAGGGTNFYGSITVPATVGANMHIAFGNAPSAWTDASIYIAPNAAARLAAGRTWTTAYNNRGTRLAGRLIADGALAGPLTVVAGATLDVSGRRDAFTLPTVPTLPAEEPFTLRVASAALVPDGKVKFVGWPATAAVPAAAVRLEFADAEPPETVKPVLTVEADGIYVESVSAWSGTEYTDDATTTEDALAFTAPACTIHVVEPSLAAVDNDVTDITLDFSRVSDATLAAGGYALTFSDLTRVVGIVQRDGWWASVDARGVTFAREMAIDDAAARTIDNTGTNIRLSILDLPVEVYESGRASVVFTAPERVTVCAQRPGWWVTVTAGGLVFRSTAALAKPTGWWLGDFTAGFEKAGGTLDTGDGNALTPGHDGVVIGSKPIAVTRAATSTKALAAVTFEDLPIKAAKRMLVGWDAVSGLDVIGIVANANGYLQTQFYRSDNNNGPASTLRVADAGTHTVGIGYRTDGNASTGKGTHIYLDGAEAHYTGMVSSGGVISRLNVGAYNNNTTAATGMKVKSVALFNELPSELDREVWLTTRPTVTQTRDALPGNVLTPKGFVTRIEGRVQAFAVKMPVMASGLEIAPGGRIVTGPGGFRNEDAPVAVFYDGTVPNELGAEVTLIEGEILAPENLVFPSRVAGCELQVTATGAKLVRTEVDEAPKGIVGTVNDAAVVAEEDLPAAGSIDRVLLESAWEAFLAKSTPTVGADGTAVETPHTELLAVNAKLVYTNFLLGNDTVEEKPVFNVRMTLDAAGRPQIATDADGRARGKIYYRCYETLNGPSVDIARDDPTADLTPYRFFKAVIKAR